MSSQLVEIGIGLLEASKLLGDDVTEGVTHQTSLGFHRFRHASDVEIDVIGVLVKRLHRINDLHSNQDKTKSMKEGSGQNSIQHLGDAFPLRTTPFPSIASTKQRG